MLTKEQRDQIEASAIRQIRAERDAQGEQFAVFHNGHLQTMIDQLHTSEGLDTLLNSPVSEQLDYLSRLAQATYGKSQERDYSADDLAFDR